MSSKLKNIIIFSVVGIGLVLIYFFFIKKAPDNSALVSSAGTNTTSGNTTPSASQQGTEVGKEFISVLLSVKSIKLNDSIFSDSAFLSLKDSSILLTPDGNEGRVNPFAPIGFESISAQGPQTISGNGVIPPPAQTNQNTSPDTNSPKTTP